MTRGNQWKKKKKKKKERCDRHVTVTAKEIQVFSFHPEGRKKKKKKKKAKVLIDRNLTVKSVIINVEGKTEGM